MPMNISAQGIALIKRFEGFSAKRYLCPAGKPTIGYGHVIENETFGHITVSEAERLLLQDLQPVVACISRAVSVPISQNQFDALCSFIYNIGEGAFLRSRLLRKINRKEPAGDEFLRWIFASGKPLEGLKNRRLAEKEHFEKQ